MLFTASARKVLHLFLYLAKEPKKKENKVKGVCLCVCVCGRSSGDSVGRTHGFLSAHHGYDPSSVITTHSRSRVCLCKRGGGDSVGRTRGF